MRRRSYSKVTADAPTHEQLVRLVGAAATAADHSSLRPWRIIELRGDARARLGAAMGEAAGGDHKEAAKLTEKAMRASLLLAVVASRKPSHKVPEWEQDATAAGVAHFLTLLLHDEGWGVIWRTGHLTRSQPVRRMHELAPNEELLGWLYVGGMPDDGKSERKQKFTAEHHLTAL
jgi:nitroreductase